MKIDDPVEQMWNRNGELDAAIDSWKSATPEELAQQQLFAQIIREEIDREILEQIIRLAQENEQE